MDFFGFLKKSAEDYGKGVAKTIKTAGDVGFGFLKEVTTPAPVRIAQTEVDRTRSQIASNPAIKQKMATDPALKAQFDQTATKIKTPADFIVETLQAVPRAVKSTGLSVQGKEQFDPKGDLEKLIYGDQPVKNLTGTGRDVASAGGSIFSGGKDTTFGEKLDPVSATVLGGLASALDLFPGKPKAKSTLEQLAKASSEQEVKKIIGKKFAPEVTERIAPAVAQATDVNVISNIIARELKPPLTLPETPPVMRERGFLRSAQEAGNVTPEVKQELASVAPQTYAQKPNVDLAATTKKLVDEDPGEAQARVFEGADTPAKYDEDVMIGGHLIQKAQSEGRIEDAVRIVERLDEKGRELGRGVQAFSAITKLSPEGILLYAQRQVSKARRGAKDTSKERPTAENIKNQVEGNTTVEPAAVKSTVEKAVRRSTGRSVDKTDAKAVAKKEPSTGEKVAKKVEREVSPAVKKKADILVNELTKKIKQELLPQKKGVKRSSTAVLREVFGRNKEAQEAFPEAQRILREKFKDDEKALATLDKFFNAELGLPTASKTIDNALREQLSKSEVRVSESISKSWAEQKQTVDDVTDALVREGFDKESAKVLGKEIHDRLTKQFTEAKKKVLERLSKEAPKKKSQAFVDKIAKLSNLGALDDADYIQLARAKLDLPDLTEETAKKISELAQKMQSLPDGQEKFGIMEEIQKTIHANVPAGTRERISQVLGAPKAALASFDLSGGGRQGAVLGSRFPKVFAKAEKDSVGYLTSGEKFNKAMSDHALSPNADIYDEWGIEWADPRKNFSEEAFRSSLPEKVPIAGIGVSASNRAYTGVLSDIRLGAADEIIKQLQDTGIDVHAWPDEWKKSMGKFINTATGRGSGKEGGLFERWAPALNDTLFSPKLWKSRLDMLNPKYYWDLKGPAKRYALQSAGSFAGVAAVILGLADQIPGAEVEYDARSSDFLKIKVGDTRYDVLGGFQQNIVFAWRQVTGEKISSQSGRITDLTEGGFGQGNRLTLLADLIESKSNPLFGFVKEQIEGRDKSGNELTLADRAAGVANLAIPLSVQETVSQIGRYGVAQGVAGSLPSYVGAGAQTYGIQDIRLTDKQKAIVEDLKANGAPENKVMAYTRFYQTQKATPDRTKASDAVNDALAKGNVQGAIKAAKDYNAKYDAVFKDWAEKFDDYDQDEELLKEYNKGRIKLTQTSLKQRLKNISEDPLRKGD
jgi:hypothetical protein